MAKARWFGKCVRDFAAMYRVSRIIQVKDEALATRLRVQVLTKLRYGPRTKHIANLVDRSFSLSSRRAVALLIERQCVFVFSMFVHRPPSFFVRFSIMAGDCVSNTNRF